MTYSSRFKLFSLLTKPTFRWSGKCSWSSRLQFDTARVGDLLIGDYISSTGHRMKVERMSPEPYCEISARKKRKGWTAWGTKS